MDILLLLVPLALGLSACGLLMFVWALRDGQFDDLEGPRWRILFDDEPAAAKPVEADRHG
jgi:cbb3-type cytochrome oxidase maturation protein